MTQPTETISRPLTVFLAWDHAALATCTFGKCKPFEMISSAVWDLELDGKFFGFLRPVVDFLLRPIGPNHCENSWKWQAHLYKAHTRGLLSSPTP